MKPNEPSTLSLCVVGGKCNPVVFVRIAVQAGDIVLHYAEGAWERAHTRSATNVKVVTMIDSRLPMH